jgi:2-haloacid dehalogenase/putative hydrolase of the HAD superfamily
MRYQAVLLDFYGTLVREDDDLILDIGRQIAADARIQCTAEAVAKHWSQLFVDACKRSLGPTFRRQHEIELTTLDLVLGRFQSSLEPQELVAPMVADRRDPTPVAGAEAFLDALTTAPVQVCIVSNIDDDDLYAALHALGWDMDHVVTSESCRAYKPRPEMFYRALHLLGREVEEAVHIGDSRQSDVAGATDIGLDTIWANHVVRPRGDISPTFEAYFLDEALSWLFHDT